MPADARQHKGSAPIEFWDRAGMREGLQRCMQERKARPLRQPPEGGTPKKYTCSVDSPLRCHISAMSLRNETASDGTPRCLVVETRS